MTAVLQRRLAQPMLGEACSVAWLEQGARYPLWLSYKFDGIRALTLETGLLSRKLKPIKNDELRERYSAVKYLWLDGELVAGDPCDPLCYTKTADVVNEAGADARSVRFYVFDWTYPGALALPYEYRFMQLQKQLLQLRDKSLQLVAQTRCDRAARVEYFEHLAVRKGFEGVMLRDPNAPYKCGRSTLREQYLLKLKRSADSEAVILEVIPRNRNTNTQQRDERGYAKRSSAKAGKVRDERALVGKFRVRDMKTKKVFKCGTGVLKRPQLKLRLWKPGDVIKYRFQPAGVKDLPRYPRVIGRRDRGDL